ncbi:MAG TPA: hypothetical protein VE553_05835, partial [Candidatus Binatia bacterium]|nr:hypothetical protein [Candidatus Binatia bacterium]
MNGGVLWREIVQSALDPQFQDLSQPLFRVTQFGGETMLQDITREAWINGIPRGVDLLTIDDYKNWQDQKLGEWKRAHPVKSFFGGRSQQQDTDRRKGHAEWLESFGSYGRKTEQVGRGIGTPAGLFEFRGMWKEGANQGKLTAEQAKDTALKMQKYLKRVNRRKDKYFGEA